MKFPLRKAVEKILEREFPEEYATTFSQVTFTAPPYAVVQWVGAVADDVVTELLSKMTCLDELDLAVARNIIHSKLGPLLRADENDQHCAHQTGDALRTVA